LFDLWRTSQFAPPAPEEADLIESIVNNPSSVEAWRRFVGHVESLKSIERSPILRSVNSDLIKQLSALDDVLFGRLMELICEWAESTGFQWEYCDVVGDRLLEAYRISPVRIRCRVVLSALELAVSHNRWHVMNQAGAMLGQAADNGLVDRMLIELNLNPEIESRLRRVEDIIHWSRDKWHPKIALYLNDRDRQSATV
jgi:hypothetical protein